ncbi:MAG: PGF-pre-PGF domain-containing protein, partial [Gammaproteobacteria bacterium]|nr:PGF-pre-PGF domain-containing protein [Gammaproteobacteria bacterium]
DNTSTTASYLDIEPPAGVTNLKNVSYAPTYINWKWTDPEDADFAGVMVYLDHVFKTNVSKGVQYYNATGLTPVTNYTISTKTVDNAGNINQTSVDNISTTAPPLEPITITIISPANKSINTTGDVNVTVLFDRAGTALLNWNGVNESMNGADKNFYKLQEDLLSGNFNFKVYAIDSKGVSNVSETTTLTVNRTKIIILSIDPETGNVNETSISLSPSGNVTIIIFNGTNVSGCDGAETEISIDSLDRLPLTLEVNLSTDELFLGENFSAFRNCLHFNPDIQLKFNYTVEQLEAAKIIESNMAVKFYNTTTSKWEVLELYERNESGSINYIIVNVSHFSIISLIGQVPSPTPPRGGGGGGGGVGTSGEAFDNILISETEREYVNRDSKVIYSFDMEGNIVQHINFTGVKNLGEVAARVEILKNTSTLVENPPPDMIYKNLNIWVGNVGWATSKNIVEPTINFRVEKFWVSENNIDESTIRLIRYTDGTWNPLITSKIYEDADNLYFEGETTEFSPFAVSGKNIPAKPGGLGEEASVEESSVQTSTEKEPGMPGFSLLICLMSLLIGAYILQKK